MLACAALTCAAVSGLPGLVWRQRGPALAAWGLGAASLLAIASGISALAAPATLGAATTVSGWRPSLLVDGLSSVFLIACGLVAGASGVYGAGSWRDEGQPAAPWTRLFVGLLVAGILGVFTAGDALTFLVSWEVMALSGFALVATHHRQEASRSAAWLYLIATRIATLALIPAFVLYVQLGGSLAWGHLGADAMHGGAGLAMLLLFLVGFGIKAGMVPGHVWLPPAHAAAPSHVSALMSGVLIKTGIYGLCRLSACLDAPPLWWGVTLFTAGAVSALLGVIWALGSHDLKRLLAFHSIENIGIILLGLGLALVGRSLHHDVLVVLGLAGALLHVLNHALFKALLFLGAGSVDHACGTRMIDRLGGLAKRMPVTAACFLVGAASICALPPFNGFVSEYLLYLGLFHGAAAGWPWALGGLIALVLSGGLALACFAKAAGMVFLGQARTPAATQAHEAGPAERAAMLGLAACCLVIGLSLPLLAPVLATMVAAAAPHLDQAAIRPLLGSPWWISAMAVALCTAGLGLWYWQHTRLRQAGIGGTWDCGYAVPTARMQYTATSFAAPLTGELHVVLLAEQHRPDLSQAALFPGPASFSDHARDPVLERVLRPLAEAGAWACARLRIAHPGWVHVYLLYLAVTLAALLLWSLA